MLCKICNSYFEPKSIRHIYCSKKCNKKAYYYSVKGQIQRKGALKRVMNKYRNNKKFRDRWKAKCHRYVTSEKGRKNKDNYRIKYRKTENGRTSDIKYRKSNKRKISLKKYTDSEKGKSNSLRASLKRRSIINNIHHSFTPKDWIQKKKDSFGICKRCNKWIGVNKLSLDHIKPITKVSPGFIYNIDDVQPLCRSCNSSKNNKDN